jgi:F420-non-reducing hydrogenase iron-sulfur subunit
MSDFKPKVIIFCCNWGACTEKDVANTSNNNNPITIQTMCSGRIEPTFIFQAFAQGADGVMVAGCHPGDCHYNSGNYKAKRRIMLLKNVLAQLGIEPERLKLEGISASEAAKLPSVVNKFIDEVAERGPLTPNTTVPKETGFKRFLKNLTIPGITR